MVVRVLVEQGGERGGVGLVVRAQRRAHAGPGRLQALQARQPRHRHLRARAQPGVRELRVLQPIHVKEVVTHRSPL